MFSRKEIEQRILENYARLRAENEQIAKMNLQQAKKNPEFNKLFNEIKDLEFQVAQMVSLGQDSTNLKTKLAKNKTKLKQLTKSLGLSEKDFEPKYTCLNCKDTGFIENKQCSCFRSKVNTELIKASGLEVSTLSTFDDYNEKIATDEKHQAVLAKMKDTLLTYANKFGETKYSVIVISGPTGVGKTFALECTTSEILKRGFTANFLTAFQLNNQFLKYHTCFDANKQSYLNLLLEPDLLVIDDLGTEPKLNNVTNEYLYLIISERMLKSKSTLISTNLSPYHILDRYGERVFSRLFDKTKSLTLKIEGDDLRRLKRS